ncbi:hypothetical protein ABZP36_027568 [Zizania latifolia]
MASSSSDLTLDYKLNGDDCGGRSVYQVMPKPPAAPALSVDHHLTTTGQAATQKLQEFLSRLEEERLKIDAFKRELPLCMQLLSHAMEAYRQQLEAYQMGSQQGAAAARPLVLEEFISAKNIGIDAAAAAAMDKAGRNATSEKASWMVSAQLWNGPAVDTATKGPQTPKEHSEHPLDTSPKLSTLDGGGGGAGQRKGGAFLPFSKDNAMADGGAAGLPELSLAPAEKDAITVAAAEVDNKPYVHDAGGNNGVVTRRDAQNGTKPTSTALDGQSVPPPPPPQTHRKARRCWSPELHRRFVNALQILGGAQVATPKQIRELMKVDGLTNDEVKSHLQKYRLHTRRPMAAPPTPTAPAPQLVVLGGIWVPPEYATQAAAPAIYGAHPATQPHYTAAVAAQEYYHHQSPAAVHHHHHLQHHPAAAAMAVHHRAVAPPPPPPLPPAYKSAARVGSPDSEGHGSGGGREWSESIEEEGEGEEREDDEEEMAAAAATNKPDADADADDITTSAAAAVRF